MVYQITSVFAIKLLLLHVSEQMKKLEELEKARREADAAAEAARRLEEDDGTSEHQDGDTMSRPDLDGKTAPSRGSHSSRPAAESEAGGPRDRDASPSMEDKDEGMWSRVIDFVVHLYFNPLPVILSIR